MEKSIKNNKNNNKTKKDVPLGKSCVCGWKSCRSYQRAFNNTRHPYWNGTVDVTFSRDDKASHVVKYAWDRHLRVTKSIRDAWKATGQCVYTVARHHFSEAILMEYSKSPDEWDWTIPLPKDEAKRLLWTLDEKDMVVKKSSKEIGHLKVPNVPKDHIRKLVREFNGGVDSSVHSVDSLHISTHSVDSWFTSLHSQDSLPSESVVCTILEDKENATDTPPADNDDIEDISKSPDSASVGSNKELSTIDPTAKDITVSKNGENAVSDSQTTTANEVNAEEGIVEDDCDDSWESASDDDASVNVHDTKSSHNASDQGRNTDVKKNIAPSESVGDGSSNAAMTRETTTEVKTENTPYDDDDDDDDDDSLEPASDDESAVESANHGADKTATDSGINATEPMGDEKEDALETVTGSEFALDSNTKSNDNEYENGGDAQAESSCLETRYTNGSQENLGDEKNENDHVDENAEDDASLETASDDESATGSVDQGVPTTVVDSDTQANIPLTNEKAEIVETEDESTLADGNNDTMEVASDHESETTGEGENLDTNEGTGTKEVVSETDGENEDADAVENTGVVLAVVTADENDDDVNLETDSEDESAATSVDKDTETTALEDDGETVVLLAENNEEVMKTPSDHKLSTLTGLNDVSANKDEVLTNLTRDETEDEDILKEETAFDDESSTSIGAHSVTVNQDDARTHLVDDESEDEDIPREDADEGSKRTSTEGNEEVMETASDDESSPSIGANSVTANQDDALTNLVDDESEDEDIPREDADEGSETTSDDEKSEPTNLDQIFADTKELEIPTNNPDEEDENTPIENDDDSMETASDDESAVVSVNQCTSPCYTSENTLGHDISAFFAMEKTSIDKTELPNGTAENSTESDSTSKNNAENLESHPSSVTTPEVVDLKVDTLASSTSKEESEDQEETISKSTAEETEEAVELLENGEEDEEEAGHILLDNNHPNLDDESVADATVLNRGMSLVVSNLETAASVEEVGSALSSEMDGIGESGPETMVHEENNGETSSEHRSDNCTEPLLEHSMKDRAIPESASIPGHESEEATLVSTDLAQHSIKENSNNLEATSSPISDGEKIQVLLKELEEERANHNRTKIQLSEAQHKFQAAREVASTAAVLHDSFSGLMSSVDGSIRKIELLDERKEEVSDDVMNIELSKQKNTEGIGLDALNDQEMKDVHLYSLIHESLGGMESLETKYELSKTTIQVLVSTIKQLQKSKSDAEEKLNMQQNMIDIMSTTNQKLTDDHEGVLVALKEKEEQISDLQAQLIQAKSDGTVREKSLKDTIAALKRKTGKLLAQMAEFSNAMAAIEEDIDNF